MKVTVDAVGFGRQLRDVCRAESTRIGSIVDDEVKDGGAGLQSELRSETEALLGRRVANAWRLKFYPNREQRDGPASFVWSKAPRIIDFFSSARVITPLGQAFAIPTDNVPRSGRGRRLTPIEVEGRFNAELQPIKLKSGHIGLVIDVVAARSGRRPGFREATKRRRAQGRAARPVLMFVLHRGPLRGQRLINLNAAATRWGKRIVDNIGQRIERGI